MKRIADWEETLNGKDISVEKLLPCHYFDYIWGTSTGGRVPSKQNDLRASFASFPSCWASFV